MENLAIKIFRAFDTERAMYPDDSGVDMVDTHMENEGAEITFTTRVGNDHMVPSSGRQGRKDARVPLFTRD